MISTRPATIEAGGEASLGKPRLGFLGVGWIGLQRLLSIVEAGWGEIVAVADPSAEWRDKAVEAVPGCVGLGTLADLLALGVDGLVIATPSAQHAAQSIEALEHGVAVFCQKPLGRDTEEVRGVIAAARAANCLLGVDLSYRHTESLLAIRRLLQAGELGEIFAVDLTFHNAYGPQRPWFYQPKESGGGCVMDLGIHLVDTALWMLEEPISSVSSRLFHRGKRIAGRTNFCEDFATAQLDFASGAQARLACSWNLPAGQDAVIEAVFYGTRGGARMSNVQGSFVDFQAERFTGTSRECLCNPPDAWGGRAAITWARQLAEGSRYDPAIEQLIPVAAALDAIYRGSWPN